MEAAVMTCSPDPDLPSGILSIQVHELRDVGFKLTKGTKNKGRGPGDDEDVEEEEGDGLPSAYCVVLVNDQKVRLILSLHLQFHLTVYCALDL
jgi:hypothetical protein